MSDSAAAARIGAAFLNGVFDVKTHYEFEKARGVHEISMLAEAAIGRMTSIFVMSL